MKRKMYAVIYWVRDCYNQEQSGIYYCYDLVDVYTFADSVTRRGGTAHCDISKDR